MKPRYRLFPQSILLIVVLAIGCTENPFEETEISIPRRSIHGQVELSDRSSPDGVYVWLESFDFGAFTDQNGRFKMTIPQPQIQAGAGLTGSFRLYFFLANYQLETATIILRNGELDFAHGDFDKTGELKESIYLTKLLDVKTVVQPDKVELDSESNLSFSLTLQAIDDTVFIQFPDKTNGPLAIILAKKTYPDQTFFEVLEISSRAMSAVMIHDTITVVPKNWMAGIHLKAGYFDKGRYKIIPYFLVDPKLIPPVELLNNLGLNIRRPGMDFLNVPMKRNGGDFEVKGVNE